MTWAAVLGVPVAGRPTGHPASMRSEVRRLTGVRGERTEALGRAGGLRTAPTEARPGWGADLDVPAGTQAVGLTWTGAPTGAAEVRAEGADGWTAWQELEANPDERPENGTRDAGGLAWFGRDGVDRIQLRVAHGTLHDLQVQTMRYEPATAPAGSATASELRVAAPAAAAARSAAGSTAPQPVIQPRSSWAPGGWATKNSGCSSGPQVASVGIRVAFVHHTVNSNTYAAADVPAMLASIYAYHTGSNGWCDIAYNFVVDRFGRIWEGRSGGVDKAIIGGHTQGFNTGSVGVSFLGQYEPGASPTAAAPTDAALQAAGRLIGWKLGLYGIDPQGKVTVTSGGSNKWPAGTSVTLNRVSGHRDVGLTACPGQLLYDQLATIRAAAAAAQTGNAGTTTTTTTAPSTTTTTLPPTTTTTLPPNDGPYAPFRSAWGVTSQGYHDVLRRSPSQADVDFWAARIGVTWSPPQFLAHLIASDEADGKVGAVIRLYRAYLLRNPDHSGFTYWVTQRGKGRSLLSISSTFAGSSEFRNRYGTLTNSAFVDLVYQNVLGRPGDASGRSYWIRKLAAGTPRGQMMLNFAQSNEYRTATQEGTRVVATYEDLLQQAVPKDVYDLYVAGLKSAGTSLTAITTHIYDSTAYRSRFS